VAQATVRLNGSCGRITRLAAQMFDTPMATISIVEADRVQFLAIEGMDIDRPLVEGDPEVGFYASAPIIATDGRALGTLNVLDRVPRSGFTDIQLSLLRDLAALAADLIEVHRLDVQAQDADRPARCQLGGTGGCRKPAETKVADSWGDSAWGCWPHAEEALINVTPVFLAHDSPNGLQAFRARTTAPPPA
jgi:phosphoserine phosphatase RsbU/P